MLARGSDIRYAVLDIQSDWPAFLEVSGSRYWSHGTPCPLCQISQRDLVTDHADRVTLDSMPHEPYAPEMYDDDVRQFTKATGLLEKIWNSIAI